MSLSLSPHDIISADYQHGHLCKHSHKVYTLHLNSTTAATATTSSIISSPPSPSEEPPHIGVVHPRANADKTGKNSISDYQYALIMYVYICDVYNLFALQYKASV